MMARWSGYKGAYSAEKAARLKAQPFDREALGARGHEVRTAGPIDGGAVAWACANVEDTFHWD